MTIHPALSPLPCRGLELCSRRYLLGHAHRKARAVRQRAGDHSPRASRCNFKLWVRIFAQNRTEERAIAGPRAFNGLCDNEGVPLICPTCQVFCPKHPCRRLPATLHGVVFDIFVWEPPLRGGEISCLKPHTPARPARGVQRRARSRLRGRAVLAGGLARPALCSRSGPIIEWQWCSATIGLGGSRRAYWKAVSEKFLSLRECSRSIGMSANFSIALMPMVRC